MRFRTPRHNFFKDSEESESLTGPCRSVPHTYRLLMQLPSGANAYGNVSVPTSIRCVLGAVQRERERERCIRNGIHNGVVSGAARLQALHGPMWAGLTRALMDSWMKTESYQKSPINKHTLSPSATALH